MKTDFWVQWLREVREKSQMVVLPGVHLAELGGGWEYDGAAFHRTDGKFFGLEGVEVRAAGREVKGWGQPMLKEYGTDGGEDGVVVLPYNYSTRQVLLSVRQEPGNPANYLEPGVHAPDSKRHILLGTALQSSAANLFQAHGGKLPPRAEFVTEPKYAKKISWVRQPQDGGRFYQKFVRLGLLDATVLGVEPLLPSERWFSLLEVHHAFLAGELNSYLVQALNLLPA